MRHPSSSSGSCSGNAHRHAAQRRCAGRSTGSHLVARSAPWALYHPLVPSCWMPTAAPAAKSHRSVVALLLLALCCYSATLTSAAADAAAARCAGYTLRPATPRQTWHLTYMYPKAATHRVLWRGRCFGARTLIHNFLGPRTCVIGSTRLLGGVRWEIHLPPDSRTFPVRRRQIRHATDFPSLGDEEGGGGDGAHNSERVCV